MFATVSSTFSRRLRRVAAGLAASLALGALSAHAAPTPFPADFRSSQVVNAHATINVRVGGHGPAVVLIHGFGDTGDMWSAQTLSREVAEEFLDHVQPRRGGRREVRVEAPLFTLIEYHIGIAIRSGTLNAERISTGFMTWS